MPRRSLVASAAGLVAAACLTAASAQDRPSPRPFRPEMLRAYRGRAALTALGNALPSVALRNGLAPERLRAILAQDPDVWVDEAAQVLYTCTFKAPPQAAEPAGGLEQASAYPLEDTFRLHSRPGAQRTVYLDFDGHTTSGTLWNNAFTGGAPIVSDPFDADGSPGSFSAGELDTIQKTWQRVAEDYACLNVDVTTEDPGVDALRRTSLQDQVYGTRVVISPTSAWYPDAGGVAYVGVFDYVVQGNDLPCFVFSLNTGNSDKGMAEAGSHEAGHTLGLNHDGTSSTSYYQGHGSWAPIMGVGYYRPITQWSRGEYAGANNTQDDFAVMAANGGPAAVDDHGDTLAGFTPVSGSAAGVISTRTDVDVFRVQAGAGPLTVNATPASVGANLDIHLSLLSGDGTLLATADPAGLAASLSRTVTAGTYYLRVDGVGAGNPLDTGYSDYGSLGAYTLTVTAAPATPPPTPSIRVTTPNGGESWQAGSTQNLMWTSENVAGAVKLEYTADGSSWTTLQASTANDGVEAWTVANTPTTQARVRVSAVDGSATDVSDSVFTITAPPAGGASARFITLDGSTQGSWKGVYGADGYQVIGDATSLPAYAQVQGSGYAGHTWANPTAAVPALQKAGSSERVAACWYAGEAFEVDLNLADGQGHRVAFYCLDWDAGNSRAQTVEVRDARTGDLLDTRSVASFSGGQYLVWDLQGHVRLRFLRTGVWNSVLSGIFFGPTRQVQAPPTQLVAQPGDGQVALTWTAAAGAASYTVKRGTAAGGPYTTLQSGLTGTSFTNSGLTNGTRYYYVVTASGSLGESSPSNEVSAVPQAPGGASARFVALDSSTQGNWKGVYGADGYQVIGDATSLPAYAQVQGSGYAGYVWANPTAAVPALQKAGSSERVAACWYAGEAFEVDLNLADGQGHRVAFYCLDWDAGNSRAQTVEVRDARTGDLLDTRSVASFSGGQYLVWDLQGHVRLRFLRTGVWNSVLSGIFFR